MQKIKPKADFWASLGCVAAMLRVCKSVLSSKKYDILEIEVNRYDSYTVKKKIMFTYVDAYIFDTPCKMPK